MLMAERRVCSWCAQWMLPRPTDIMSLRLDNTERHTVELADIAISSTRYIASWLRQRSWALPENRCSLAPDILRIAMGCDSAVHGC